MINVRTDEDDLFFLACRFRSTRDLEERKSIAAEYAAVVDRLIARGDWEEAPAPDAQLPREYMPQSFWDWLHEPA